MSIAFSRPYITERSLDYVRQCVESGSLQGDGPFTKKACSYIEKSTGSEKILLTSSCTDALEMTGLLLALQPGDEVIMPSYTFSSTATAYVMRGAVPVFVDSRLDTINIDETKIEAAITAKTKAIVVMHYGGVACDMEAILAIGKKHGVPVIEDAAHAYGASYRGRALGTWGALGTYSFHNTKNISSGEGGALLIQEKALTHRAEILAEKGTDRANFMRGDAAFYTWRDMGSSFLMSDLAASFLMGQLEEAEFINNRRLAVWASYHDRLEALEAQGRLRRPVVPEGCAHNAHLYYILLPDAGVKDAMLKAARAAEIGIISHYVPLHSAPAGEKFGRAVGDMKATDEIFSRLVRLPMHAHLTGDEIEQITELVEKVAG